MQFNPLILTTVTTTRKIFTTVYSVFRNPANRLVLGQWAGCSLVFVGMLLEIAEQVRAILYQRAEGDQIGGQAQKLLVCCVSCHRLYARKRRRRPLPNRQRAQTWRWYAALSHKFSDLSSPLASISLQS